MTYANITTQIITSSLPTRIGNTWNPTLSQLQDAGWRSVSVVDSPATGYRVTRYGVTDMDGVNCRLTVAAAVNVAEETAAQAAVELAQKESESQLDNAIRIEKGLALTLLDEINLIRGWFVAFKAAVAASTSLANLQTRIAALPDTPDRTVDQLKTAVFNKAKNL